MGGASFPALVANPVDGHSVETIFERLDDLELAGEPEWGNRMFIRGLNSLPVACRINAGRS